MALIGEMQYLTIGDSTYSIPINGGSTVQVERNLTSGTKSATITVDGTSYELFAPSIPSNVSSFTNDAGYITSADVPEGASAYAGTISAVGTSASTGTNNGFARGDHVHNLTKATIDSVLGTGSGTVKFYREDGTWATPAYTTNTDTKLQIAAVTSGTTYYPIVGANSTTAATRQYDATGIAYTGTNGTANGTNGNAVLALGNSTASTSANWKKGTVRLYGTTAYYTDLVSGAPSGNRTITLPNKTGTVALTSDIPTVSYPVTSVNNKTGAVNLSASDVGALPSTTVIPSKTSDLTNDSGFVKQFVITITGNDTDGYSADKTFSEIVAAYQNGYEVVCHCTIDNSFIPFLALSDTMVQFELSAMTGGSVLAAEYIKINNTNKVTHQFMNFTETDPVFIASAAAGITNSDISNWDSKTSNTGTITSVKTTAGAHTTINVSSGAVNFNVPTATSHLTNDSGFITSFTDENVKNTTVTAATTYYLTGSTSSSTATGGLSKHAAIKAYVTANSGTGGSARIDLGNTTATTSAGGKEGIIRLYGTSATYYVELKAGAPSANRTISFPNKAGTVALTDDIPTVSYPVTSVNSKTGAVSLSASDVGALASSTTYVSTITTSAGTHSTISSKSGAVSFNVPTKTSHLTNDSGFVTSSGVTGSGTSGYLAKWNGSSTVTNGPQLGSSTTTFLRNDGTWATPPVGVQKTSTTVTLTVAGWSDYSQTVTASGVTTSNDVIITPAPESAANYVDAGILCTTQASGSLTFQCSTVPESAVSVNVLILT